MMNLVSHDENLESGESPRSKNLDKNKISPDCKKSKEESLRSFEVSGKEQKTNRITFPNYISLEEVHNGLKAGILMKGILRINPKFPQHSYVENGNSSEPDYLVSSLASRNRALDRDEVILKIKDTAEIEDKEMEVVHIAKKVHPRSAVGYLKPIEKNKHIAWFVPRDKRFPKMTIHKSFWPNNFASHPDLFKNILFLAQISKWTKVKSVQGEIIEVLGEAGNLKVESQAILREFSIHPFDFDTVLFQQNYFFTMEFLREDLRRRCVFTIDNAKTTDMDDALSCQELPNGNYEIGVHISDVSHYLREDIELDKTVSRKATSAYLIDASHHMLPQQLLSLCSLEPGKDKLTFSVFIEMTPNGEIRSRRAAKSVINSCVQLSYEQAQMFIDEPNKVFDRSELPPIYNGFIPQDLSKSVNNLHKFAHLLRELRRRNCGIRQHRKSISFEIDDNTGEPISLVSEDRIPSRELVEEFMLSANFTVAQKVYHEFPDLALLRVNEAPIPDKTSHLTKNLESVGIHIDTSSSKKIQESLDKYIFDEDFGEVYSIVLNRLISKCKQKEKYVCPGKSGKGASLQHFGLGFSIYTHFTSPIRRYADVVVHRLLAAALRYRPKPQWKPDDVSYIANICNQQEFQAKKAAEASFDLYLSYYIERRQPYIQEAVVYNVKEDSFDVIVFNTGTSVRIYTDTFEEEWTWRSEKICDDSNLQMWKIVITFPDEKVLVVDLFTVVKVELFKMLRLNRLKAKLCGL